MGSFSDRDKKRVEEMKRIWKDLRKNITVFLSFEILFRIFLIFLCTRGIGKLVDLLLRFQGYSYVTQGNYLSFLSDPTAIFGLFLCILLLLFLILYESCGLLILYDVSCQGHKISLVTVFLLAWNYSVAFIRRHPLKWIPYMSLCLPNLYLHLLVWEVDRARFIDIVAADICDKIGIPAFVVILSLYLLLSLFFSLTLPFRVFQRRIPYDFNISGYSARKKKQLKILVTSFYLHIRVFISAGLFYMLAVVICVCFIRSFQPVYRYVSDALFYGSYMKLLLGIVIGFLGTVTITVFLYASFRKSEEAAIDWEGLQPVKRPRLILCLVLFLTGVILVFEGFTFIPDTTEAQDYLEISAHRGGAKYAPENTLAAIQYSIDTKADYAEIDVQETSDGVIVLLHDNWLGRTAGLRKYIWNTSYAEIQTLDAGSFFSLGFKGEKIPTLEEVIEACRGKLRLNIEIKSNGHNDDIVEKVLEIIQKTGFESNCVVTSMDYKLLKQIKELSPEVVTGYTLSMVYGRVEDMEAADFYSVKYTFVTHRLVERVHEMGKQICAWTTNNRTSIRKVIDAGVDNVITDDPELVRKELMGEYDVIPGFVSLVKYMIQ